MSAILLTHPGSLYKALFPDSQPRILAAVGGGGKTTFLKTLATELHTDGARVILTTTTKMRPPEDPSLLAKTAADAMRLLDAGKIPLVGQYFGEEKIQGIPGILPELSKIADYILIEADGSRNRPLKMINTAYEPVIPPEAEAVVALAGLDAVGSPISEAVHRPELACSALGLTKDHPVVPRDIARLLTLCYQPGYVILNKADDPTRRKFALETASHLPEARCVITSLQDWGQGETR